MVLLERFTSRDGVSYAGLLDSLVLLEKYSKCSFLPSIMICVFLFVFF